MPKMILNDPHLDSEDARVMSDAFYRGVEQDQGMDGSKGAPQVHKPAKSVGLDQPVKAGTKVRPHAPFKESENRI